MNKENIYQKIVEGNLEFFREEKKKGNTPMFKQGSISEMIYNDLAAGQYPEQVAKKYDLTFEAISKYMDWWTSSIRKQEEKVNRKLGKNSSKTTFAPEPTLAQVAEPEPKKEAIPMKESNGNGSDEMEIFDVNDVDMKQFIPTTNGYIERDIEDSTDLEIAEKCYNKRKSLLIIGETGCGKTHLLRHLAYKKKLPYARLNLNGATTPEDLIGQWIPNPTASKAKYIWKDGQLTTFFKKGGILVLDEINMASGDILAALNGVLDDEKRLVLTQKDSTVLFAHKDFWLASTMNPDYEGTKPLNLALKDRFTVLYLDYNDKVEKKLKIGADKLKVSAMIRKSTEIRSPVSTRSLLAWEDNEDVFGKDVALMFFINSFAEDEQNVVKELITLTEKPEEEKSAED